MILMEMDSVEELMIESKDETMIVKGKRTYKRPRQLSRRVGGAVVTSSCSSGDEDGGGRGGEEGETDSIIPASSGGSEISSSTEEDEDMANCLILLAQNRNRSQEIDEEVKMEKNGSGLKGGIFVYECKTCSRSFPSFQALGGHRASHKKPKQMVEENKVISNDDHIIQAKKQHQFIKISPSPLCNIPVANKSYPNGKLHECTICGLEFSSGQALGGHMRRHRNSTSSKVTASTTTTTITTTASSDGGEKPRIMLDLDLNLPAPEADHHHDSSFQFSANHLFSSPALVGCHY